MVVLKGSLEWQSYVSHAKRDAQHSFYVINDAIRRCRALYGRLGMAAYLSALWQARALPTFMLLGLAYHVPQQLNIKADYLFVVMRPAYIYALLISILVRLYSVS